ncbi:hypothetical protein FZEAL_7872 [Fusarium zealandicum]|uniref:Methyltransferase type 12 domain-containing protein n=1 Tax=Fusarium zealandicum TaxID=1053134 RepID=A0A8H4UFQ0_9HYPO|nr:hypothetical protein FZEAL_7872 [Fusarium zealandicum]
MSVHETLITSEPSMLLKNDGHREKTLHAERIRAADFFTGHSPRPATPPTISTMDNQVFLSRAAMLIIRAFRNNISYEQTFDACSLSGYRSHIYRWMESCSASEASQILLKDVPITAAIEIFSSLHSMGVEGEVLSEIGLNLRAILEGALDPMPLLLEDGRLERIYNGIETVQKLRVHMRDYLSLLAAEKPGTKVLEVGGSTSKNTGVILEAFEGRNLASYTLADASTILLQQTKSAFLETGVIKLKALDINRDPIAQGFKPESYDVVVVNNILHIGNSLETVLVHVRRLLAPGGALVIVGMTDLSPSYGLIFGLMESMWSDNYAAQLQLPSRAEWGKLLSDTGFSGLESATKNFERIGQSSYCVVSTAVASTKHRPVNILVDGEGKLLNFAGQLSSLLATSGISSTISFPHDTAVSDSVYVIIDQGSSLSFLESRPSVLVSLERLSNARVLWVSLSPDDATRSETDMSTITSITRQIREANRTLKLASLAVRRDSPQNLDILRVVSRLIQTRFQEERGPRLELDYEYSNDGVFILRTQSDISRT